MNKELNDAKIAGASLLFFLFGVASGMCIIIGAVDYGILTPPQPTSTATSTVYIETDMSGASIDNCAVTLNNNYAFISFGAAYDKPCTITIPTNHTALFEAKE